MQAQIHHQNGDRENPKVIISWNENHSRSKKYNEHSRISDSYYRKRGVGKTTITSLLSHLFAGRGYSVLAVDEDPQMNLPYAIGVSPEDAESIVPLSKPGLYRGEDRGQT